MQMLSFLLYQHSVLALWGKQHIRPILHVLENKLEWRDTFVVNYDLTSYHMYPLAFLRSSLQRGFI